MTIVILVEKKIRDVKRPAGRSTISKRTLLPSHRWAIGGDVRIIIGSFLTEFFLLACQCICILFRALLNHAGIYQWLSFVCLQQFNRSQNTNNMADIITGPTIPIPETDYLSYVFNGPYDEKKAWPSTEPILVSTEESDPSYTINDIKDFVKRLGCGLHHIGARRKRVMLYGEANIHFFLALLGVMAAGSACAVIPPSSVHHIAFYLRQMEAEFILCGPNDIPRARDAAHQVGIPPEHIFVVDRSASDIGSTNEQKVRHWSWLLNIPGGSEYVWPRLGEESKEAEAILLCTSGYVTTRAFINAH